MKKTILQLLFCIAVHPAFGQSNRFYGIIKTHPAAYFVENYNLGVEMGKKSEICANLYNLLCASCHYQYFSSDDSFNSVGVEQPAFFRSVLQLIDHAEGKIILLNRGLDMAVNNSTSPNTSTSEILREFVNILDSEPLKYDAIEKVEKMIDANKASTPIKNTKRPYYEDSSVKYYRERKTNNLAELGFRLYASMFQYEEAIVFFNKYHTENSEEIKLYILVRLLFESAQKTYIQSVLEAAAASGIKLRDSLTKMLVLIQKTGTLPQYM